ncbi:16216_t:CDS:2 [Rhizophagus irregularis]|nr:16216_t:CDS:2 [Rhizophagus irregularis]
MPVIFESIGSTGLIKSEEGQVVREVVQKEFSGGKGSYNTRHETLQPTPESGLSGSIPKTIVCTKKDKEDSMKMENRYSSQRRDLTLSMKR